MSLHKAGREAVEYVNMPGVTGRYFRCVRLTATLQVATCSRMFREAKKPAGAVRSSRCVGCPVGAHHSGEPARVAMAVFCCRCGRDDLRMVAAVLCVSCYNRSRENDRGANRKGGAPSVVHRQRTHTMLHLVSRRRVQPISYRVTSTIEALLRAARDHDRGRFQWSAPARPPVAQLPLW